MSAPVPFERLRVEIYRMSHESSFTKDSSYIVAHGSSRPVRKVRMRIGQRAVHQLLHWLRATSSRTPRARAELGRLAERILGLESTLLDAPGGSANSGTSKVRGRTGKLTGRISKRESMLQDAPIHIDLVINAEELWAIPFEACLAKSGASPFVNSDRPVVLTRRLRSGFGADAQSWPTEPRVLFIRAGDRSVGQDLIAAHLSALERALAPWILPFEGEGKRARADRFLTVLENPGARAITNACKKARKEGQPFTHVHILAHGKQIREPGSGNDFWGLALGGRQPITPEELVHALAPRAGLPAVVTLAACDSANQAAFFRPERSLAQELHRAGVPVVVGSQLPFGMEGSRIFVQEFYARLLHGQDVRHALHATRVALRASTPDSHDWLSLVAYVRLSERYGDELLAASLRAELALLEAANEAGAELEADDLPALDRSKRIEGALRERIQALGRLIEQVEQLPTAQVHLEEAQGLLASAHKRLAQLLFERAQSEGDEAARQESARILAAALEHYERAYKRNLDAHWLGVQWLSLSALEKGRVENTVQWDIQHYIASQRYDSNRSDYWVCGTLAELLLLAPTGAAPHLERATTVLKEMQNRVRECAEDDFPIRATRRQLLRYTRWWTKPNGFFRYTPDDLSRCGEQLLTALD